jgi:CheY-like chemotaxis protein
MSDKTLAGRRVLLVEDEMLIAMLAQDMLEEAGCLVTAVGTVQKAVGVLEAGQVFDAAIVDLNLNGERSFAVADVLATHGIPFAFATGYGRDNLPPAHQRRPVLPKPYHEKMLEAALIGLLRERQAQ